jgi:hypothetical protein
VEIRGGMVPLGLGVEMVPVRIWLMREMLIMNRFLFEESKSMKTGRQHDR